MKRALTVGLCSLILAGCGSTSSSSNSGSSGSGTAASPVAQAAQKLASLDPSASASDFETVLNALQPVCTEGPEKLASEIYNSQQDLLQNNRQASLLHVAQALETVGSGLGQSATPTSCASLLAAYLVTAEAPGGQP